jgi:hypothetical protein
LLKQETPIDASQLFGDPCILSVIGILSSGLEPGEGEDEESTAAWWSSLTPLAYEDVFVDDTGGVGNGFSFFIIVCWELLLSAPLIYIVDLELPLLVLKLGKLSACAICKYI